MNEIITCEHCVYRKQINKEWYCTHPENSGNGAFFAVKASPDFYCKRAIEKTPDSIFKLYKKYFDLYMDMYERS